MHSDWFADYMTDCRAVVLEHMQRLVESRGRRANTLYKLVLDYPLRSAKALRPSLCIAVCRALGGTLPAVAGSAMTLELYHNAFLIHDDIEDGSDKRRDELTLHRAHGLPIAVNVGDAMLALALEPLLENLRLLGVGKALRVLQTIAEMAVESAEGQATELDWCQRGCWDIADADYLRMVHKKTSYYSFLAPAVVGAIVADARPEQLFELRMFATALGAAFQIRDDVLNLDADEASYGKDFAGDLWEGKHTLILLHALRQASPTERTRALHVLKKARTRPPAAATAITTLLAELEARGELEAGARQRIECTLAEGAVVYKAPEDVLFLRELIARHGSTEYALRFAARRAERARQRLARIDPWLAPGIHRDFLHRLTSFVVERKQ